MAGSILDGVIGTCHSVNPSGGTVVAPGWTPTLTEMCTRVISWGDKDGRCVGLKFLSLLCHDCQEILGGSTSWSPKGLSSPV